MHPIAVTFVTRGGNTIATTYMAQAPSAGDVVVLQKSLTERTSFIVMSGFPRTWEVNLSVSGGSRVKIVLDKRS